MPKFSVKKSIVIDAPVGKVFPVVRDFKQWRPWSPWLIAEPDAKVDYAEDGRSYSWEGKVTGEGGMTVLEEEENRSIGSDLRFIKPWKSQADVRFEFAEKDGGTEVAWSMDSQLPFFMFFMKGMMETFIGMDYQRGLMMLKDYVETGDVPSKLSFPGTKPFAGMKYVGIKRESTFDKMPEHMGEDFCALKEWITSSKTTPAGKPFSIYHKWKPTKGIVDYSAAIPVDAIPSDLGSMVSGEIPACQVYPVEHTGRYEHLSNAWSAGMMHGRAKVFRQDKSVAPFETYENDPEEVDEKDLVTIVHLPAK